MPIKLKVCGLRDNAQEVLDEIKPDFAGFIYYEKSPRYVGEAGLKVETNGAKKVGVFVNETYEVIVEKIRRDGLSMVQLHGHETPELCLRIKHLAEVIKVFSGNQTLNFEEIRSYEPFVDYFLFDHRGKAFGGSGMTFEWEKLKELHTKTPIILSGGIGLKEIEKIKQINGLNIYAIDVNSKFEIEPGLKAVKLLKRIKDIL